MKSRKENKPEVPEFRDVFVPAFCALMLHKLGGTEEISLDLLERFPAKDTPIITWNDENQSFVMANPIDVKDFNSILTPKKELFIPNIN